MTQYENLYQLYADFGMAAEKVQVLELEMGNVVLSLCRNSSLEPI